jgi:transposase-like protein
MRTCRPCSAPVPRSTFAGFRFPPDVIVLAVRWYLCFGLSCIVLEELLPVPWYRIEQHANNWVEADHGRLKSRLRPMRGLEQDRSARVIIGGHAFVQSVRRGHYELAPEEPTNRRLAVAFDELALAI